MSESVQKPPVSVVVAMWNSATTILPCLKGLVSQDYPVAEILVIDNASTDQSVVLVEEFMKQSPVPLRLIKQTVNGGLTTSYNTGLALAISPLVIFVHSDSMLPTPHEMERLVLPLLNDPLAVATCSTLLMPFDVWTRFPFWQKHLFARVAQRGISCMCGKFDCVSKEAYLRVGGHNTRRFTQTCGYGGEDSDLHFRLSKQGTVVRTKARVIHLHDLSCGYGLRSLFKARKNFARTYGKILIFQGMSPILWKLPFFAKPSLACLPFLPHLFWAGLAIQLAYSLWYSKSMYTSRCTLLNVRILLVPFVDVALLYYESFWFVEALLTPPADALTRSVDEGKR